MKRFSEQFNKKANGIRMRSGERAELRERLISYMEYHPLPNNLKPTTAKKANTALVSEPFAAFRFDMSVVRAFAGIFAMILVVVVPVMAERSVPGDVLYQVKVQFNEELRSTLTISPYAQVEWETERLERRLAEARLLATAGKLTDEVEAEVATAIKTHSDKAKEGIAKLRETDADEAALAEIAYASALAVQSEVLEGHMAKDRGEEPETVGHSVVALAGVIAKEQEEAEASSAAAVQPSYNSLLARVETETTNAYELFESVSVSASEEEVSNIERRLADIERKVLRSIALNDGLAVTPKATTTEGGEIEGNPTGLALKATSSEDTEENTESTESVEKETVSVENNYDEADEVGEEVDELEYREATPEEKLEAVNILRTALADTRKLISFMTNLDVRDNVEIEDLVPVTLTNDERLSLIKSLLAEAAVKQAGLENRVVSEERFEKFVYGKDSLDETLKAANEAFLASDLKVAESKAHEALKIAKDLYNTSSPKSETAADGGDGSLGEDKENKASSTASTE